MSHCRLSRYAPVLFALSCVAQADTPFETELAALLAGTQPQIRVAGEVLWSTPFLRELYAAADAGPLWDEGRLAALREAIAQVTDDGLEPTDYLADRLLNAPALSPASRELLATEALGRLAFTLRFGKSNPAALDPNFNYSRSFGATDPVAWLRATITGDALPATLAALRPDGRYYRALVAALAEYRALQARGGWVALAAGPALKPAMAEPRVPALRARLAASGELDPAAAASQSTQFDATLVAAIEAFQRRHGLEVDGIVGRATLAALNVPVAARIAQLRVNLERLRWVFRDRAEEFVAVNIAAFQAVHVVQGEVRWRGRAIVGQPYRQTPIFKANLTHLVLNPTWTVPPTILRKDILPKLRQDPDYLALRKLRVFDREGRPVDASTIDWRAVWAARFPYVLRQDAGPDNALGRIKFMFPNPHAVYLHDTPARALFDQAERTFSSGCIRVDDPLGLAERLLRDPGRWSRAGLEAALATGATLRVELPREVPIMLLYLTAFPGTDGALNFRRDVYSRDAAVLAALDRPLQWAAFDASERKAGDTVGR